jgi:hypothetical protein
MNRNIGLSAGTIVLAAVLLRVAVPGGGQGGRVATAGENRTATKGTSEQTEGAGGASQSKEEKVEGPWLATRRFFGHAASKSAACEGPAIDLASASNENVFEKAPPEQQEQLHCHVRKYFGIADPEQVTFLIATVPDPLHSRLALLTDSSLQAIQKAAARSEWVFASEWLPWADGVNPKESDPEKRRRERQVMRRQERQPGLLVFRHSVNTDTGFDPRVLLVFVVGETPTAGLNKTQFDVARRYMRAIREPAEILVQGPTFSGSFDSLYDLIVRDSRAKYVVQSGSATSEAMIRAFQKSGVEFYTTQFDGNFRALLDVLGLEQDEAAVLEEDETEYGQTASKDPERKDPEGRDRKTKRLRTFYFPRDMSHLRNAYREVAAPAEMKGAPEPDVEFSLKDTDAGEDSIPVFSKSHSPLSQNAVLTEITAALRRDRVKIVQIGATNVLDLLFLTRTLKRQCPDTRVVISSPDLLFVEAAQTDGLAGTLALSTYPMFMAANSWMNQRDKPAIFPDAHAEAVYNATLMLLNKPLLGTEQAPALSDYGWRNSEFPPTWVLMLDRKGFMPVRTFQDAPNNWFRKVQHAGLFEMRLDGPPGPWIAISGCIALLTIAVAAWIFYLGRHNEPTLGAAFGPQLLDADDRDMGRRFYLVPILLLLIAMQLVVWIPFWRTSWSWSVLNTKLLPGAGVAAALAALVLLRPGRWKARKHRAGLWIAYLIFAVGTILWLVCCFVAGDHAMFFSFRTVELRTGSSPAWPILTALAILLVFAVTQLRRIYLAVYETPEILVKFETMLQPRLEASYNTLNQILHAPIYWGKRHRLGAALAALVFLSTSVWAQLRAVDGLWYDVLSLVLTVTAVAALLLICSQANALWRALQGMLACLNPMPLSNRFLRSEHTGRSRPIWVAELNVQSIDVHAQILRALHDMVLLRVGKSDGAQWREWLKKGADNTNVLINAKTRTEVWQSRVSIRALGKEVAAKAFRVAQDGWRHEYIPLEAVAIADGEIEKAAPQEQQPDAGRLAESLVALHYSPYLVYCVRQIRNLLFSLSIGFLLLVASLNSYSYQAPQFIGKALLVLFLLMGAVTFRCIVGMERDPILSRIAGTTPGKLDMESYFKLIGYGALPILALLASQFPSVSGWLYTWITPTLEALR